jgi:hypothetical protein
MMCACSLREVALNMFTPCEGMTMSHHILPASGTLASRLSRLAATELHEARLVCSQATSSNRSVGGVGNGHEAKPSHVSHSYTLSGPATSSRQPASTGWGLDAAPVAMDLSWDLVPSGLTTPAGLECFSTGYIAPLGGGSTTDVSQPPDQQPKASKQLTAAKAAQQKEIAPAQGSEWASHLGDGFSLAFDMDVLQQVCGSMSSSAPVKCGIRTVSARSGKVGRHMKGTLVVTACSPP